MRVEGEADLFDGRRDLADKEVDLLAQGPRLPTHHTMHTSAHPPHHPRPKRVR